MAGGYHHHHQGAPDEFPSEPDDSGQEYERRRRRSLQEVFDSISPDSEQIGRERFTHAIGGRSSFFSKRLFDLFDEDGDGAISRDEFVAKMLPIKTKRDKIDLLFRVYDSEGTGMLTLTEVRMVIDAMLRESSLNLDSEAEMELADAFFRAAREATLKEAMKAEPVDLDLSQEEVVSLEGFRNLLLESPALSNDVSTLIDHWLGEMENEDDLTSDDEELYKEGELTDKSTGITRSDKTYYGGLVSLFLLTTALMLWAGVKYHGSKDLHGDTNGWFIAARVFGFPLNTMGALVFFLMTRGLLNKLREWQGSVARWLPMDHNVILHMIIGYILFIFGVVHTSVHLINFGINIKPDPGLYFSHNGIEDPIATLDYKPPESNEEYSYTDWIFTTKPGLFGRVKGWANITGILLMVIMTIITLTSTSAMRRRGHFNVFYYSHICCYVAFFILMIIHAPNFAYVCWLPAIFLVDRLTKFLGLWRLEKTYTLLGILLPSNTVCLVIKKPTGMSFSTGDWVSINAPEIARFEWHSFTISSSPEVPDVFTVHIKVVGPWTSKLAAKIRQDYENLPSPLTRPKDLPEMRLLPHEYSTVARVVPYSVPNYILKEVVTSHQLKNANIFAPRAENPLILSLDGPFHAPTSDIFQAEHAVLISTGIGVTPMTSILHSILYRHWAYMRKCTRCGNAVADNIRSHMGKLKKVDFFWIVRDPAEVSWFIDLLLGIQKESQESLDAQIECFLDVHIFVTRGVAKTDMCAAALRIAFELINNQRKKDILYGLDAEIIMSRPDIDTLLRKLDYEKKGEVSVFFCGNPGVEKLLKKKCRSRKFNFHSETF